MPGKRDRVGEHDRTDDGSVIERHRRRVTAARRRGIAVRRRACVLAVLAGTAAFGFSLGGRAVSQIEPTPTETTSPPTQTCAPTDSPSPSPTEPSPTPTPSPTEPCPSPTDTSAPPAPSPTDTVAPSDPSPTDTSATPTATDSRETYPNPTPT